MEEVSINNLPDEIKSENIDELINNPDNKIYDKEIQVKPLEDLAFDDVKSNKYYNLKKKPLLDSH